MFGTSTVGNDITAEILTLQFVSDILGPCFSMPDDTTSKHTLLDVFAVPGAGGAQAWMEARRLVTNSTLRGMFIMEVYRDLPHKIVGFSPSTAVKGIYGPQVQPGPDNDVAGPTSEAIAVEQCVVVSSDSDDDDDLAAKLAAYKTGTSEERIAAAIAKAAVDLQERQRAEARAAADRTAREEAAAKAKKEAEEKAARKATRAAMRRELAELKAAEEAAVASMLPRGTGPSPMLSPRMQPATAMPTVVQPSHTTLSTVDMHSRITPPVAVVGPTPQPPMQTGAANTAAVKVPMPPATAQAAAVAMALLSPGTSNQSARTVTTAPTTHTPAASTTAKPSTRSTEAAGAARKLKMT